MAPLTTTTISASILQSSSPSQLSNDFLFLSLTPTVHLTNSTLTGNNANTDPDADWSMTVPASAELFVIFLATSFFIISAAALRVVLHSTLMNRGNHHHHHHHHHTWSGGHRGILLPASEADTIRAYSSFHYGSSSSSSSSSVPQQDRIFERAYETPSYETLLAIGDMLGAVKKGLTDEQISVLPTYQYRSNHDNNSDENSSKSCVICRDDFDNLDVIRVLPCGDEFHSDCIGPWLKQQASCPLCRNRFT